MEAKDIYTDPEYIAKLKNIIDAKISDGFCFFYSAGDAHTDTYCIHQEEMPSTLGVLSAENKPDPAHAQRTFRFCSDIFMQTHKWHAEDVTKKVLEKGYHLMTRVQYAEVPSLEAEVHRRRAAPNIRPGVSEYALDYVFLDLLAHGPTPCGIIHAGEYDPNSQILSAVLIEQKPESSQENMSDLAAVVTAQGLRTLVPSADPLKNLRSLEEKVKTIFKRKVLFFDLEDFQVLDCV